MTVKLNVTFGPPSDPDAFERYYVETHAPLVKTIPGLRAYEYGRALTNFDGSPPDAFWVATLSFDSEDAMHAAFATPEGQKTTADMPNFIAGPMKTVVSQVL
jgi:uncharacterized protein (TIGR02118 family)